MSILTLSSPIKEILGKIGGEPESKALRLLISGIKESLVEVYYNSLTDKKSFALIKENQRILGYDNYKYWHIHPRDDVTSHVPCQEPSIEKNFEEMKEIILSL